MIVQSRPQPTAAALHGVARSQPLHNGSKHRKYLFMASKRSMNASTMRQINMAAVLDILREKSPISRTEIASILHMSLPTVMRIVDDLVEEKLIHMPGDTEQSGGRPRTLLELNQTGRSIVGVDLGGSRIYGALVNIGGDVLDEVYVDRTNLSGEAAFEKLSEVIDQLINSPWRGDTMLSGIGVGAPGLTLHEQGVVTWAPSLEWRNYPLKDRLAKRFDVPITVDNDVNLATLGELWFGQGRDTHNMVLITIGTGIGAGLVIDGVLYRGQHEAAGEIGYVPPGPAFLGQQYAGFGALESLASEQALMQRARRACQVAYPDTDPSQMELSDVIAAYQAGEPWAQPVIDDAVDYLSLTLSVISAVLDPEKIVIGGSAGAHLGPLLPQLNDRITGVVPTQPEVLISELGLRGTVLGAITSTLHTILNYHVVHRLS